MHKAQVVALAHQLGFLDCRMTRPFVGQGLDAYRRMVATGAYGDMGYLARHLEAKENPALLLPGVQTAMVVTVSYKNTTQSELDGPNKVARYAAGADYHQVIQGRLDRFVAHLREWDPGAGFYAGVDSRPLAERSLAIQAGIGFKGRNHMVIRPGVGSYFFIAVVLTTVWMAADDMLVGTCGQCTRCIDACPPAALGLDGSFNIQACTAYQTIERKTPLTDSERAVASGWVFGCDRCQEVCPFNHDRLPLGTWPEFDPANGVGHQLTTPHIPRHTALYRSRHRVRANFQPVDDRPSGTPSDDLVGGGCPVS